MLCQEKHCKKTAQNKIDDCETKPANILYKYTIYNVLISNL